MTDASELPPLGARPVALVTGAAGFIGSHLTEALIARGHRVVALDEFNDYYDPRIKERNLRAVMNHEAFVLYRGDIRDRALVARLFARWRPQVVYHLAARAGVRPSVEQPALYQSVNIEGTQVMLDMAVTWSVPRFVFASSSSVYGASEAVPFRETDPADQPVSPYAATKRACELIAHAYAHLTGMVTTGLRYFTAYGPRQRPDMAIHKFARLIEAGETVPMFGDGDTYRDYTYIDDIIDGTLRAGARGPEHGTFRVYNLGESRTIRLGDLVQLIGGALGRDVKVKYLPPQPGDVPRTNSDPTRGRTELGYDPQVPLAEGLQRFVAWMRGPEGL